jgi:hypothetical protein
MNGTGKAESLLTIPAQHKTQRVGLFFSIDNQQHSKFGTKFSKFGTSVFLPLSTFTRKKTWFGILREADGTYRVCRL